LPVDLVGGARAAVSASVLGVSISISISVDHFSLVSFLCSSIFSAPFFQFGIGVLVSFGLARTERAVVEVAGEIAERGLVVALFNAFLEVVVAHHVLLAGLGQVARPRDQLAWPVEVFVPLLGSGLLLGGHACRRELHRVHPFLESHQLFNLLLIRVLGRPETHCDVA